jgi:acetylglutamate kinase
VRGPSVIVLKVGGEVVTSPALCAGAARLCAAGERLAIVHGGGPQLSRLSERLGLPVRKIAGRRYTDEATMEAMKMAVCGQASVDLCGALRRAGVQPVGLSGAVFATKRPPRVYTGAGPEPVDLGQVGDVTGFDLPLLHLLWSGGRVPVLSCLGTGPDGALYNINADTVAAALARALPADRLLLFSDTPVLRDAGDRQSRLPRLSAAAARELIRAGAVQGGMIAKVEEACGALDQGVAEVVITADLGDDSTVVVR